MTEPKLTSEAMAEIRKGMIHIEKGIKLLEVGLGVGEKTFLDDLVSDIRDVVQEIEILQRFCSAPTPPEPRSDADGAFEP